MTVRGDKYPWNFFEENISEWLDVFNHRSWELSFEVWIQTLVGSGCVPLVLITSKSPFLFFFYSTISNCFSFMHAPIIWWLLYLFLRVNKFAITKQVIASPLCPSLLLPTSSPKELCPLHNSHRECILDCLCYPILSRTAYSLL